jgi:hypothetical protein
MVTPPVCCIDDLLTARFRVCAGRRSKFIAPISIQVKYISADEEHIGLGE